MNIQELIHIGIQELNKYKVEDSNTKARILLQHILKQPQSYLVINSNEEVEKHYEIKYKTQIQELIKGRPLQYITNKAEFMGLEFYVDANVLIPQPDTEVLVEETIKAIQQIINKNHTIKNKKQSISILDMCTGSGAIAISLAKYLQKNQIDIKYKVYGLDISEKALKISEKNAKINNVEVEFILSNMFDNINKYTKEKFDIIVSNPPYIETDTIKILSKEVQNEPHIALDGGKDGLDFYKIIAENGYKYLKRKWHYTFRNRL